ncbi:MAG: patatin-like phospholipase family protein [Chitinophagaceae bacterium]
MKNFFLKFYHSFPVQLLLLHIRKYQILLVFWLILFSTLNGSFAKEFGAVSLFLAPEYLGRVSFYSEFILGVATGTFILSWNLTTFILQSKRFIFLATTTQPFFKYCINNSVLPLLYFGYFFYRMVDYQSVNELSDLATVLLLAEGFLCGFLSFIFISFFYFFNADRTILRSLERKMGGPRKMLYKIMTKEAQVDEYRLPVTSYFISPIRIRRARKVDHYDKFFLESVFKKHHFAAIVLIGFTFLFLVLLGYLTQYPLFRIPAGASVLVFFSVLIAFSGAFSYFLRSWAIPAFICILGILNVLVSHGILDTRNKAYGLDYRHKRDWPVYNFKRLNQVFNSTLFDSDQAKTIGILDKWAQKFPSTSPLPKLVVLNVSGGGSRSAAWTMDVLQRADSLLKGQLMAHTVLITGSSGGMVGAAYFRELCLEKLMGKKIDLYAPQYAQNVSRDLLNAVLSSFAVTDFFTPFLDFRLDSNVYPKDRGYAFEQQLDANLGQVLNKSLGDYALPERQALIPMMIFCATITADGRRLLISPQPVSYLTYPQYIYPHRKVHDIDGIDFSRFFWREDPQDLRITSAIRMCATFPYILPNVFLPSRPIIDVMDGGLRDNYGQQTSLRFLHVFRNWINTHTSGVIFIQIRDTKKNETVPIQKGRTLQNMLLEPLFTMQKNWSAFQDYDQDDLIAYAEHFFKVKFDRIIFEYVPQKKDQSAALNWHLTSREKRDIDQSLNKPVNLRAFQYLESVFQGNSPDSLIHPPRPRPTSK